jgi:glucose dehydrogenase
MLPGLIAVALFAAAPAFGWEHWGGDRGGTRFSPLAQITPANVGNLIRAWLVRAWAFRTLLDYSKGFGHADLVTC